MIYVLDFAGNHQNNQMVHNLINGVTYQPVDLTDATDQDFENFLDYIEVVNTPENQIYVYMPYVGFDGEDASLVFAYIRNHIEVKAFIAKGF